MERSLGEEINERVKSKERVMCLNGMPLGSVTMQSVQLPQVTDFKYMVSTLQSDGDINTDVNRRTQCGWNNCRNIGICQGSYATLLLKDTTTKYPQDDCLASYSTVRNGDNAND